ncbi:MAG: signal peptidase I [Vallitaleaceae bacterium]|nr:signal peptidase I [Vallitaleaceae bacterium]
MKKAILENLLQLVIALGFVFLLTNFVIFPSQVDGSSMNPTLTHGDFLIIDRISKNFDRYERFDVVVFRHDEEKFYIKRIIGMPGESLSIENHLIYIDGKLLKEPYSFDEMTYDGYHQYPVEIPNGYYFVLGDNRNHSTDSRFNDVGLVAEEDLVGKGFLRIFPFQQIGIIE